MYIYRSLNIKTIHCSGITGDVKGLFNAVVRPAQQVYARACAERFEPFKLTLSYLPYYIGRCREVCVVVVVVDLINVGFTEVVPT